MHQGKGGSAVEVQWEILGSETWAWGALGPWELWQEAFPQTVYRVS